MRRPPLFHDRSSGNSGVNIKKRAHPGDCELRPDKATAGISQFEDTGVMGYIASRFEARRHGTVVLMSVEPGEKNDASFVVAGWRTEDLATKGHGRGDDAVVLTDLTAGKCVERRGSHRRYRIENSKKTVR